MKWCSWRPVWERHTLSLVTWKMLQQCGHWAIRHWSHIVWFFGWETLLFVLALPLQHSSWFWPTCRYKLHHSAVFSKVPEIVSKHWEKIWWVLDWRSWYDWGSFPSKEVICEVAGSVEMNYSCLIIIWLFWRKLFETLFSKPTSSIVASPYIILFSTSLHTHDLATTRIISLIIIVVERSCVWREVENKIR